MTYLERHQHRELRERADRLRRRLEEGDSEDPLTRKEALELLELVDGALERMSPERWDHTMEVIAEEAARRAGRMGSPGPR